MSSDVVQNGHLRGSCTCRIRFTRATLVAQK
nr:MAG TPA: hypothetical protein [Caudoviricetes sp.]